MSTKNATTIVFPLPLDIMKAFGPAAAEAAVRDVGKD
jgi:hypothetical protein